MSPVNWPPNSCVACLFIGRIAHLFHCRQNEKGSWGLDFPVAGHRVYKPNQSGLCDVLPFRVQSRCVAIENGGRNPGIILNITQLCEHSLILTDGLMCYRCSLVYIYIYSITNSLMIWHCRELEHKLEDTFQPINFLSHVQLGGVLIEMLEVVCHLNDAKCYSFRVVLPFKNISNIFQNHVPTLSPRKSEDGPSWHKVKQCWFDGIYQLYTIAASWGC